MKVYKTYYLWNNEKVYLKSKSGGEVYATSRGVKCAIRNDAGMRKYYNSNYKETTYFIEEYECELSKVCEMTL